MATNEYGQNYIGNDDYRGWLAAKSAGGDTKTFCILNDSEDCLIVVSGYNSRNGVVNNYTKK